MSPSNSSTSPFNTPIDAVSSVVSMLKGALERKKVGTNVDTEFVFYNAQEVLPNTSTDQLMNDNCKPPFQLKDSKTLQMFNGAMEVDIEDFVDRTNMIQLSAVSQEPSQSESSAAPPILSTAFEVCDGPINSGQNPSVSESSRKQVGNGSLEHGSKTKDFRERIVEKSLKDERKKGGLARMGSVTSIGSVEKGDPTKKRRVERSRKMAEAKERNLTPAVPTDVQSILKRCENLEKEVRSLKLNLSFMNRKDSEQTKQIEDLQKQNEDLADEKERLLEEIERILSETGNM
ncbi:hypothetical protein GIB67_011749 [Kingdonia uniflora]|uniref:Uncharacterized protein n=1 Tax=Kingdonia uniflora TaxID=39325 RepID=A0A7J7LUM5_9MAGN|nr:hypothetical protein GIB67_011749 [Kingdonia uniflora]